MLLPLRDLDDRHDFFNLPPITSSANSKGLAARIEGVQSAANILAQIALADSPVDTMADIRALSS